ncbi:mCG1041112 [Mus musculus]|nr:mCG1041112 [Mus musculus]
MVFHLSERFLENSEKLTEASGCFFLCYSQKVCKHKAYEDILPLSFFGSPLPTFS